MSLQLFVVMPVFNEQDAIRTVLAEWLGELRSVVGKGQFTLCVMNDGSTDATAAILHEEAARTPELQVVTKSNSGHGQTCIAGYRMALASGVSWILQIDSDGQCDPRYFRGLWQAKKDHPLVFGYRKKRLDGHLRRAISRVLRLVVWGCTGVWVADPNVPFRLMHRTQLEHVVDRVPPDFKLANALLSALLSQSTRIQWHPILFRQRLGGRATVCAGAFIREAWRFQAQLRLCRRAHAFARR